jgi:hypothetical protein
MRSLIVLVTAAAIAVAVAAVPASGATVCTNFKSGKVAISKLRATHAPCATATKVAKTWAKTAPKGHCVPKSLRSSANCTISGYRCRVTAQPTAVAPKELATCKRGSRKLTWVAFFS